MFDHDALTAALQPPQLKIGGQVHVGRVLSYPEYLDWVQKFQRWREGKFEGVDQREEIVTLFTDLGFPLVAVELLLKGPPAGIAGAAVDFFTHQWQQPPVGAAPPAAAAS